MAEKPTNPHNSQKHGVRKRGYIGSLRSTYGKTDAIADLKRSFPANTDAAWFGYAMEMYIKMLWKVRKIPGR